MSELRFRELGAEPKLEARLSVCRSCSPHTTCTATSPARQAVMLVNLENPYPGLLCVPQVLAVLRPALKGPGGPYCSMPSKLAWGFCFLLKFNLIQHFLSYVCVPGTMLASTIDTKANKKASWARKLEVLSRDRTVLK